MIVNNILGANVKTYLWEIRILCADRKSFVEVYRKLRHRAFGGFQILGIITTCFLYKVPAHGIAGVMGRVTLDAGQAACLVEHRIYHPGIHPTVAVSIEISIFIDLILYFHDNAQELSTEKFSNT